MHLLDLYATSTGSKIDKPFIYTSFFPIPEGKYITLQAWTKSDSRNYAYWQDVINIIFPILSKQGYRIIQTGGPNDHLFDMCVDLRGKTTVSQLAYLIQNASLHLGVDSLGVHLAAGADVPIVALYSYSPSKVCGPYFGSPEKQILIETFTRTGNKKASFNHVEHPKSVNMVKPEEIANAVLKLLKTDIQTPFETVYIGDRYSHEKLRDLVPTNPIGVNDPNGIVEVRMDLLHDENVLFQQLNICKCNIICNKPVNFQLLKQFRERIPNLLYEVTENDDPSFIPPLKKLGFPIVVFTDLTEEQIAPKKINYYEDAKINSLKREKKEKIEELRKDAENLYYRSNKIMMANGKFYYSNAARLAGIEAVNEVEFQKVIDTPDFWKELNFMHLVKKA